jgi:diguanylate cyclase (GGDEF)-like protein
LLMVQAVLILLLCGTLVLTCAVRASTFWFYLMLVGTLAIVNVGALVLNLSGRYIAASWLTVATVTLGPWVSLLLDSHVTAGDYIPIVYVALTIQLCSILLSAKATGILAGLELIALSVFIAQSDVLRSMNWPSLVAFMVFMAALGSVSSAISRKQVKQIEAQRNRLLEDEAQLRELSVRDALTGLYNRRYMEQRLDMETEWALRNGHSLGVVMVDVDEFKAINDTYGHAPGDKVLCEVADMLRTGVRKTDIVCRFGGDEFVLIMPDCPLADCVARAEDICTAVERAVLVFDERKLGRVSLSMGVAALPDDGKTAAELVRSADAAMYAAKNEGKNCVRSAQGLAGEEV